MIEPEHKSIPLPPDTDGISPRLKQLFRHLRKMENKLEAWLEEDAELQNSDLQGMQTVQTMLNFRARDDIRLVKQLVPDEVDPTTNSILLAWENLVPFFEGGFLLQPNGPSTKIQQFFFHGVRFEIPGAGVPYRHRLPQLGPLDVKRMSGRKWLAKSGFSFLDIAPDSQAFLFQPERTTQFVLLSSLPEIWLEDQVKHTQQLLNNATDRATVRTPSK